MSNLPRAPRTYDLRDQDEIRRILRDDLTDALARLETLELAPSDPPVGDTRLRIGPSGAVGTVVNGPPGSGRVYPIHGTYPPTQSGILADINAAIENDIFLVWTLVGARGNWLVDGVYSPELYESRTRRFTVAGGASAETAAAVTAALTSDPPRAVIMLIDEPNHSSYGGTVTPTDANDMGLLVKSIWPGAYTFIRSASNMLVTEGWTNVDSETVPPAGGWSGVDFGFAHFNAFQGDTTPAEFFAFEKETLALGDLGMLGGLNIYNGGLETDMEGIPACWDYLMDGVSSGVIVSTLGHDTTVEDGEGLPCGDPKIGTAAKQFVASPDWRRHVYDVLADNPDLPISFGFALAGPGAPNSLEAAWAVNLQARADMVAAQVYGIDVGLARTSSNGWPAAK